MLYSEDYKTILKKIHSKRPWGGGAGSKAKHIIKDVAETGSKTILDYGCGNGTFKKAVLDAAYPFDVYEYDPGIPGKDKLPDPQDYLVCIDVLEHIEPECLDDVLRHIASLMKLGGLLHPCISPSTFNLEDGRNAHLIVENAEWWEDKIKQYFNIHSYMYKSKNHLGVYVRPK